MKAIVYRIAIGLREMLHPNGMAKTVNNIPCRFTAVYGKGVQSKINIPMLSSLLEKAKSAKVVLELGGHIGIWTELISNSMPADGKIFVFEPNPFTYKILQKQVKVSLSNSKITTVNKAVGSENGNMQFHFEPNNPGGFEGSAKSRLVVKGGNDKPAELIDVAVVSVDSFCKEYSISPDVIKMDIEGAEYYALQGMKNLLSEGKAKIIIELHQFAWQDFGYSGQEMLDFIALYPKYVLKDPNGKTITKADSVFLDNLAMGYAELMPVLS